MAEPVLRVTRLLRASRERVFDAWITPESAALWFSASVQGADVEMDARVGGRFRIAMRGAAGEAVHTGTYHEIRRPERLVFTWCSEATHGLETLVTVELRERDHLTELVLTHEQLPDADASRKHARGWADILGKLADHLASSEGERAW